MPGSKPERKKDPSYGSIPQSRIAAARALYEGTPGMTLKMLAEKTGLGKTTCERYANNEGWKKNHKFGDMTPEAQAAADRFERKMEEFGPEATADDVSRAVAEVVHEVAVDARAEMLDRHRREWAAPRAMSAEAVRMRDTDADKAFHRAKMAKITSETLKIIQDGERKAWGLDVGEVPPGSVVVIERA